MATRSKAAARPPWRLARVLGVASVGALGAMAGLIGFGCALSSPRYNGPKSDHFDGERFVNPGGRAAAGFGDLFKWLRNRDPGPWRPYEELAPGAAPPHRVEGAGCG